jgi:hypothetical protein
MAEHLGVGPDEVNAHSENTASLMHMIASLRSNAKTLNQLEFEKRSDTEIFVADNEILDPEHADGLFEPPANRGLWKK